VPTPYLNDPTHWRARAAEMRALAGETNDIETSRVILRLAEDSRSLPGGPKYAQTESSEIQTELLPGLRHSKVLDGHCAKLVGVAYPCLCGLDDPLRDDSRYGIGSIGKFQSAQGVLVSERELLNFFRVKR
jgi:hypothetical protein